MCFQMIESSEVESTKKYVSISDAFLFIVQYIWWDEADGTRVFLCVVARLGHTEAIYVLCLKKTRSYHFVIMSLPVILLLLVWLLYPRYIKHCTSLIVWPMQGCLITYLCFLFFFAVLKTVAIWTLKSCM